MSREPEVDGPVAGQVRSPWTEWLLSIGTLGVYAAIRHHRVNRELRDFGVDVDPGLALLAFFPGVVLGVPFIVTIWRTSERVRVARETVGLSSSTAAWRAVALAILCLAHIPSEQAALNEAWGADDVGSP